MFIYNSKNKQLYETVVLMFCIPNKKQFDYSTLINQEVTKEQFFFNSINPSIYMCQLHRVARSAVFICLLNFLSNIRSEYKQSIKYEVGFILRV